MISKKKGGIGGRVLRAAFVLFCFLFFYCALIFRVFDVWSRGVTKLFPVSWFWYELQYLLPFATCCCREEDARRINLKLETKYLSYRNKTKR